MSTGEMLREATKEKDTFGLRVQEYMNKGELVPDEWINSLAKSRLQAKDVENGFVLDGYPRTLQQAKMLEAYLQSQNQNLDAVFFLDVSQDTLRHRLAQRGNLRSKEKQGNSQIESKREKIRLDDKLEVIENRLHINKELMESLIHFYKERNLLYVINGEGDFDNVFDNINEGLLSVNK
ncbi:nucleoside monophosphate kinase [Enterococcus lactis]|nr:nucleoside monophosphate kinase [Enterococcus lactis]